VVPNHLIWGGLTINQERLKKERQIVLAHKSKFNQETEFCVCVCKLNSEEINLAKHNNFNNPFSRERERERGTTLEDRVSLAQSFVVHFNRYMGNLVI
jgi:hypothetical protein